MHYFNIPVHVQAHVQFFTPKRIHLQNQFRSKVWRCGNVHTGYTRNACHAARLVECRAPSQTSRLSFSGKNAPPDIQCLLFRFCEPPVEECAYVWQAEVVAYYFKIPGFSESYTCECFSVRGTETWGLNTGAAEPERPTQFRRLDSVKQSLNLCTKQRRRAIHLRCCRGRVLHQHLGKAIIECQSWDYRPNPNSESYERACPALTHWCILRSCRTTSLKSSAVKRQHAHFHVWSYVRTLLRKSPFGPAHVIESSLAVSWLQLLHACFSLPAPGSLDCLVHSMESESSVAPLALKYRYSVSAHNNIISMPDLEEPPAWNCRYFSTSKFLISWQNF